MRIPAVIACALSIASFGLSETPNILLITCDNLGYGDLKMYRPESSIETPRLDQLAREGARLTQFYTASPTCTVSRACLLTGRIPQRHGLVDQLGGIEGNYGIGLNQNEILIPQMLKSASQPYRTGCFGKWNIGFAEGSRPTERGFDQFFGHASGNIDYYHHRYSGKRDLFAGTDAIIRDGKYATDLFADAAIKFIQTGEKVNYPWFCYLPFNAPHFPNKRNKLPGEPVNYQAPDSAFKALGFSPEEADPKRRYDAAVYALDEAIGRVLDAVDGSGQRENTFVFFMSDNGAFRLNREGIDVGINDPLRSGGVTCWEGGLRVPALARWPKKIEPGSVVDAPLWSPDLFVACSKLAGIELPERVSYDGRNPLPSLTHSAHTPHESFYFSYRKHAALREGEWKIVREKPGKKWRLFNLKSDPGETIDRSSSQPETVSQLARKFQEWENSSQSRNLAVPPMTHDKPAAGKRVQVTPNEYDGSEVHHSLYLPNDWSAEKVAAGKKWPVIAEYTGNHFPDAGSTGEVNGAGLGYGISRGNFIWVVLPFIEPDRSRNAIRWWGDEKLTIEYAKQNVPRICEQYGGDSEKVLLCGFSRGAIAVNYIGLHDDEIAKLWSGFITHDHYDGVKQWGGTKWGSPLEAYQKAATERLLRIGERPVLICQNGTTTATEAFITGKIPLDHFTFITVNTQKILGKFPNQWAVHPHNDRWLLKPGEEANTVAKWIGLAFVQSHRNQ